MVDNEVIQTRQERGWQELGTVEIWPLGVASDEMLALGDKEVGL